MGDQPQLFPVAVRGVVFRDARVLLLRNERDEWELPGGQLRRGEDPAACVAQEIREETGWTVATGPILDAWQYRIRPGADVLIVTYGCYPASTAEPVITAGHRPAGLFTPAEADQLRMPAGYQRSVQAWAAWAVG